MSAADKANQRLVIGGVPRADLLPPEIKQDKAAARQRSNLVAGLILVVFLVGVGYAGSAFIAIGSNAALAAEQQRSAELLAEQGKYSEVRDLQAQLAAAQASLLVASAAEVDWSPFLSDYLATLPAGSTLQSLTVTPSSATGTPASSPLYPAAMIEIIAVVETASIPDSAAWQSRIKTLPGFADWSPSALTTSPGGFTTTVTVHLGIEALWNRYFPTDPDAESTPEEEEETAP